MKLPMAPRVRLPVGLYPLSRHFGYETGSDNQAMMSKLAKLPVENVSARPRLVAQQQDLAVKLFVQSLDQLPYRRRSIGDFYRLLGVLASTASYGYGDGFLVNVKPYVSGEVVFLPKVPLRGKSCSQRFALSVLSGLSGIIVLRH